MVTMLEVAAAAGVSTTTVSHVINKSRPVDPATEKRVLAAIEDTGYHGDGVARSLRKGKTETIGLAMSSMSNPYFGEVVHAIERRATAAGYSLLLTDTHDDPEREVRAVSDLLSRRVDALILAPSENPARALKAIAARHVPTVLVDRVPEIVPPGFDAIGVVNTEPNAQLVDHLAAHGHRRIATITSRPGLTTTLERLDGYWAGLDRNGLKRDPELVVAGDDEPAGAEMAIDHLLSLDSPPTAIIMGNNQVTIAALRALKARNIAIPGDIAIAAFDDFPWADLFEPRLTAMSQPVDGLGEGAVNMLLERLKDPDLPPRKLRMEPDFHLRSSCGTADSNASVH